MLMCTRIVLVVALLLPDNAAAQSTRVSASVFGNIVRTGSFESNEPFVGSADTDGESIGFGARVARDLGENWGVELELAVPAEIERIVESGGVDNFLNSTSSSIWVSSELVVGSSLSTFVPPVYRTTTRRQHTTVGTSVYYRQDAGDRLSLAYSVGLSFVRRRLESESEAEYSSLPNFPGISLPSRRQEITSVGYGVGALVGFDAQIAFGERLSVVPGIRLHSIEGWLIRPGVGVSWRF